MPRFFIDNSAVAGGYAVITGSDARHISLALRMRAGDAITLCDFSRKEYECVIDSITPSEVRAKILSTAVNSTEPPTARVCFRRSRKATARYGSPEIGENAESQRSYFLRVSDASQN